MKLKYIILTIILLISITSGCIDNLKTIHLSENTSNIISSIQSFIPEPSQTPVSSHKLIPVPISNTNIVTESSSINEIELKIHEMINKQRQQNGISALTFDSKLGDIARKHSQDMESNNFFEHTNLNDETLTDRATNDGYICYKDYGSYYTNGIAENIFMSTDVPILFRDKRIASDVVNSWMNSPGHRKNILTQTYDREGIGVSISFGQVFITEDFC